MGMYWCARSVEGDAEIKRIRDCRDVVPDPPGSAVDGSSPEVLVLVLAVLLPIRDSA